MSADPAFNMPTPIFASSSIGSDQNISLQDVFQDVFFDEDGSLMDMPPASEMPIPQPVQQQHPVYQPPQRAAQPVAQQRAAPALQPPVTRAQQSHSAPKVIAYPNISAAAAAGALTEEQKLERRERNREHAKRSRVRKKFLLESLQRSVDALQSENDSMKDSIREHLGARGEALLEKCTPAPDSLLTSNPMSASRILDDPDYSLVKALQTAQQNFVITDAALPDNPIVYASGGFLTLTGYKLDQVLGRNCRFVQGPETDPRAVDKIRNAIAKGEDTSVCLLNYRADSSVFWNQFFVAGLRDAQGKVVNYVGVQSKVSDEYAKMLVDQQNLEFTQGRTAKASYRRK